ncbi:MAG: phosphoadenosine phosphosulfate reductase family protein [Gemmataceae bacterium]
MKAGKRPDGRTDDQQQLQLTHLKLLEAESIHIIREVAAEFERPVMLYSIGKDSAVMLRLAQKAFHPGRLPFPLLHVDTTWKFRAMIEFRDRYCREQGLDLKIWINPEGQAGSTRSITARRSTPTS